MAIHAAIDRVTVVIRSAGERTEAACRHLVAHQVPEENIIVVSNAPFSATLADSFRAGIEKNLPWTFCVDADVLVRPGAVSRLVAFAENLSPEVCEVQGLVLDKLFGVRRPAGNHLYRTSWLSRALGFIPTGAGSIRPEHYTLNQMAQAGHPWVETPLVVGLHDFEQYHRDIFRKCYVHARKFASEMHLLVEYWRRMAVHDNDYRVALWGCGAGIMDIGDIQVDVRRDLGFSKWADAEGWSEKPPLEPGQVTPEAVESTLAKWPSPGPTLQRFEAGGLKEIIHGATSVRSVISSDHSTEGLLRMLQATAWRVLGNMGRRLERLASDKR